MQTLLCWVQNSAQEERGDDASRAEIMNSINIVCIWNKDFLCNRYLLTRPFCCSRRRYKFMRLYIVWTVTRRDVDSLITPFLLPKLRICIAVVENVSELLCLH